MLLNRFAIGDPTIPSVDELMKDPKFVRLIMAPGNEVVKAKQERELVTAGRGRPRKK